MQMEIQTRLRMSPAIEYAKEVKNSILTAMARCGGLQESKYLADYF